VFALHGFTIMPAETLHTCTACGRGNFTARGLRAHVCRPAQPGNGDQDNRDHHNPAASTSGLTAPAIAADHGDEASTAARTPASAPGEIRGERSQAVRGELVPVEVEVVAAPGVTEDFAPARTYLAGLRAMGQGAAVMAVMLGTELRRLHKLHGVRRGRPSINSRNVSGIKSRNGSSFTWPEIVKNELGISDDSARNYMELAEAAKKRLPDFGPIAEELLNTPLAQLPDIRRAELTEKTRHLLPNHSAQQLAWDWGISKRPADLGGYHPSKKEPLTADEEIALQRKDAEERIQHIVQVLDLFFVQGCHTFLNKNLRETYAAVFSQAKAKLEEVG
jgi:hypothetical protein